MSSGEELLEISDEISRVTYDQLDGAWGETGVLQAPLREHQETDLPITGRIIEVNMLAKSL